MRHPKHLHPSLAAIIAGVALLVGATGCTVIRPLDESSWRFVMGRSYSATEYQTTVITKSGQRIVAAPLCARVYDMGKAKSLRMTLDNTFAIPFSEIRAFTFNTALNIETMNGTVYDAEEGNWWFMVHDGATDGWAKTASPTAIDYSTSIVLFSRQIREIRVPVVDPLALGILYGAGAGALIFLGILLFSGGN